MVECLVLYKFSRSEIYDLISLLNWFRNSFMYKQVLNVCDGITLNIFLKKFEWKVDEMEYIIEI